MPRAPLSAGILTPLVTPDLGGVKVTGRFHICGLTFGFFFIFLLTLCPELLYLSHNAVRELGLK